ncbi:MAG: beta-lactamase family protein [Gemmatimonadetes bacterium]|nr:beta-lactamase family protein [Gemmatimonadota bacterium]
MDPVRRARTAVAPDDRRLATRWVRHPLLWVPLALLTFGSCTRRTAVEALPGTTTIDSTARALMQRAHVEGLALAVIDAGAVVHVAAYGIRNAARDPLTTETIMYGASLTKTAFTYMVMQLVDEGRLSLDAPIADLLPRPLPEYDDYHDLASDPRWKQLTLRILLTHTSGFANFRWLEDDGKLRFHHEPGSRYGYSGEGFYIAQLVLEEALGLDVGREMQVRIFDRFGMPRTSMQWRPDFRANLADGFRIDGTPEPHDERSSVSAAGSMDTDIADQARLWAAIVRGEGLSPASRREMMRGQAPITSRQQFPTLAPDTNPANRAIGLAAGLGVVTFQDTRGAMWFKGGHNEWTGNMVICLERGQRCLVLLSNDVRAERIYPDLAQAILGQTRMPWAWEYDWHRPGARGA